MATFFGEILPVASRAGEEEEEDDEDIEDEWAHDFKWTTEDCNDATRYHPVPSIHPFSLVVAVGNVAAAFVESYLTRRKAQSNTPKHKARACMYTSHSDSSDGIDKRIFTSDVDPPPHATYSLVDKLVTGNDILILCSGHISSLHTEEALEPPVLRGLATTEWTAPLPCPHLEQPNIVSGLAAAVLQRCQIHKKRALLLVCYTENMYVDTSSVNAYWGGLKSTLFHQEANKGETSLQQVIAHMVADKDNLYA
ncbi:PREDICTED: proteasome assembly chaperone 1-like [Priapulus caudatus]|uniref:Proteasome assembly chaperone 1 n=1 Tax=Priapulus caudatus TaxID=37621 RepID=A0ABM1E8A6_PRICU|nr:PREDICTED: proteasome assembly chaperone 1-like [Priapulus caudatus]